MIPNGRWLEHLRSWLPVALEGEDPEGVHQVRNATRRLDVWLRLGGRRALRDDLRWLRTELGPVRDLDVLATLADEDLRGWFLRERAPLQARVREIVTAPRTAGLVAALATMPPIPTDDARRRLRRLVVEVRRRGDAIEPASADTEALHRLRRAVRRARYGLDWLGDDSEGFEALQDAFGELNDHAVLLRWLERHPDPVRVAHRRAVLHADLDALRAHVVQAWRAARPMVEEAIERCS